MIDLTNEGNESEDIQKAIAASLADSGGPYTQESSGILGGQVSREEQDISRYTVNENSLFWVIEVIEKLVESIYYIVFNWKSTQR